MCIFIYVYTFHSGAEGHSRATCVLKDTHILNDTHILRVKVFTPIHTRFSSFIAGSAQGYPPATCIVNHTLILRLKAYMCTRTFFSLFSQAVLKGILARLASKQVQPFSESSPPLFSSTSTALLSPTSSSSSTRTREAMDVTDDVASIFRK